MITTTRKGGGLPGTGAALLVTALAAPGLAHAQPQPRPPRVGEVQRLKAITISMRVGSTEKESKQVTYTPPPGWYVRSHSVSCTARHGPSSFTVNTVPRDWNWLSEEKVKESYKYLIELAGKANKAGLQAKFALERDALLEELRRVRATHHALVVDATARGEGFLRGGGGLELTVTAELVYLGTEETLKQLAAQHQARLEGAAPGTAKGAGEPPGLPRRESTAGTSPAARPADGDRLKSP